MAEPIQDQPPGMGAGFNPLGEIPKPKSPIANWEPLEIPQPSLENKQNRPTVPKSPNN